MEIVYGILLFLTGLIAGAVVMGLVQAKRTFEVEAMRQELERRLKEYEEDWNIKI